MAKVLYIARGFNHNENKKLLANIVPSENIFAALDMPGLYVDKKYQTSRQRESHDWCYQQTQSQMQKGSKIIGVSGSFERRDFVKKYKDLALEHGYEVLVLHLEETLDSKGEEKRSQDSVGEAWIKDMRSHWQTMHIIEPKGMNFDDLAQQLQDVQLPNAIILDLDKTLCYNTAEGDFSKNAQDYVFNHQCEGLRDIQDFCKFYVASNQRGLAGGQIKLDFLQEKVEKVVGESELSIQKSFFATARDSHIVYERKIGGTWYEYALKSPADKPNVGIYEKIRQDFDLDVENTVWIVGDSHSDEFASDWQFAQAVKKFETSEKISIHYVPVELLQSLLELLSQQIEKKSFGIAAQNYIESIS